MHRGSVFKRDGYIAYTTSSQNDVHCKWLGEKGVALNTSHLAITLGGGGG